MNEDVAKIEKPAQSEKILPQNDLNQGAPMRRRANAESDASNTTLIQYKRELARNLSNDELLKHLAQLNENPIDNEELDKRLFSIQNIFGINPSNNEATNKQEAS